MISRIIPVLLLLACILCTAGCTQLFSGDIRTTTITDPSTPASIAKYKLSLAQPEESAKLVRMDTDVYNIGEVVEFVITNEKNHDLSCSDNPPSFSVRYQGGTGQWVTRMGEEHPAPGNTSSLKPGESTAPFRFITTGWAPGRYRIVSDCGVSREILLRALPPLVSAGTPCPPAGNASPYIRVNPVSDQYAGEPFTIAGTTNLAAGEKLQYSIFAIVSTTGTITSAKLLSSITPVHAGSCGTNTWSADGVITVPGDYFIGISNGDNTISAIRRFSVLPESRPVVTATLPEKTNSPGISTG
ncbi:MAG: hypothetical protein EHM53_04720 [Methanoregulaceae archaeon]|nr:MAG: hypothetical protein EHM53_04720 [Methanoregulaceae archaeon]